MKTSRPRPLATLFSAGAAALLCAGPVFAQGRYDPSAKPVCTYRVPAVPVMSGQDDTQDGLGGPEPIRYDSARGVWVDPVSGEAQTAGGEVFGHVTDAATGARFLIERGLWVDTETRQPLRDKRLNDVPYFDWRTGESVDPVSGARSPYARELLTIGASRAAAFNLRFSCLGDDLSQRIDPRTGRYLERPDGAEVDATMFPTFGESKFDRLRLTLMGDAMLPRGFPDYNNFSEDGVRERFDLTNGEGRDAVIAKLYAQLAPESAEGGGRFELLEARTYGGGIAVLVTASGLMDDAVGAEQVVVYFDTSMGGRPRLMNAGIRRICGRSGDHAGWTVEAC